MIRKAIPLSLVPLCIIAGVLAATPWLKAFPSSVIAAPLFGAAVVSVLVPVVAVRAGLRRLWQSLLADLVVFVLYGLAVVLHSASFGDLVSGVYRGPSQILTFALPLVSPRSLLVAPVALTWLAGMLAGECVTRRWFTVLPYPAFLVGFGLAYAATRRADTERSHLPETLLAVGLLVTLLLLRVVQTWVRQDETAESTQADGILPLRGVAIGVVTTVVVGLVAGFAVQSEAFTKQATAPQRVPSIDSSRPLTPLAFVASLRPKDPKAPGSAVFTVTTDRATPGYFGIANVDYYDGAGWSFDRTFRPSGGVLPADADSSLRIGGPAITQAYRIDDGPLISSPWMPVVYRPQKITGASVNIDPDSGMIVPAGGLGNGEQYRVESHATNTIFDQLKLTAVPDTGTAATNTQLPGTLRQNLADLVSAFSDETGTPSAPAIPFLQALQRDLQTRYALVGNTPSASASVHPSTSPNRIVEPPGLAPTKPRPRTTPRTPSPTPSTTISPGARAGATSFADVLGSIVGADRAGSPEQYATLVALIARQLGVPARVVTGFRVAPAGDATTIPAGRYQVSTAQAWTWVEVPIVGVGWVVLDASPSTYSGARHSSSAAANASPTPSTTPTENAQITKSNGGHAIAPKSTVPHGSSKALTTLVIVLVAAALALLLALLVLLLVRKRWRRLRRRRSPDPRQRVLGAWRESIDVLTEAGLPDLTHLTSAEIAGLAGEQFGPDPGTHAGYVGQAANTAVYSSTALLTPEDADAAWRSEQVLRRQVGRQLGVRGRFAAWLRYHRSKSAAGPAGPASWAEEHATRSAKPEVRRRPRRYRGRRRSH